MKANHMEIAPKLAYFYPKCRYSNHKPNNSHQQLTVAPPPFYPSDSEFFSSLFTEKVYPSARSKHKLQRTKRKHSVD